MISYHIIFRIYIAFYSFLQGVLRAEDWFVGVRTMEGPFHCEAVPVRRCPDVNLLRDGRLILTKKTFHQGAVQLEQLQG